MTTNSKRGFPVESESEVGNSELNLVFEKNGVEHVKNHVFGHF